MSNRQSWIGGPLTKDRRALIDQWNGPGGRALEGGSLGSAIPPRLSRGPAPLSFAQERLWFLEQLHPGQSLYVIPVVLRLTVAVSVPALRQALDEIVRRHEVLRSSFLIVDDLPRQIVDPIVTCPFQALDLRELPPGERALSARQHLLREAETPFDLVADCRLRATLLTLGVDDHVLVCTFHHIAFDGWSTAPFMRELTELYAAFVQGASSPLPPLPIQYADYASWQRHTLSDTTERAPLLEYWTGRLADLRVPEIEPDFVRPVRPTYRAGRQTLTLPGRVVAGLKILAQREGVTPFMTLLAAVSVVIQRYTTQDDVCVGTSVAGRSHAELEPLIGCCLNTLALRTDLSSDPRVSELLSRVRETALGAFAHQALPFELLLQELQPARDLSRTPLFQVYVNFLNVGEFDPTGARVDSETSPSSTSPDGETPVAGDETHAPFDLALYARPSGDELVLSLVYARDLFETSTAARFLRDLRTVIGGMVEHPDDRISTLALVRQPDWRATPRLEMPVPDGWLPLPAGACEQSIGSRFLETAKEHAERTAVRVGSTAVTYQELGDRSARIAAFLRTVAGVGDRVCVLLGHDETMIGALMGVLQSGAAYVPLDPAHPVERLAAIVNSSRPVALLVDEARLAQAEAIVARSAPGIRLLRVEDAASHTLSTQAGDDHGAPDTLAYLLYTSGSTGAPKGVVQSHRNVLRHVRAYANSLRIVPGDRLSLVASYSLDAAVMDIFGALLTGACLVPIDLHADDSQAIARTLSHITILHATPTVYRHLLSSLPEDLSPVRAVVLGGEPALRSDVESYRRRFSDGCLLVNGLGPTESTLALQYVLDQTTEAHEAVVPVGFPVPDTEVTLLNVDGREVGALAVGEIAIRSEHVALGYWNDDALTRKAFLPDPAGGRARTYLSGDLARRDRQGCLEFVGRRDAQIKIRGIRIEPAEIERRLSEHPSVLDATVVATSDGITARLAAYIVCRDDTRPDASALRRFLRDRLPDAMVPSVFVGAERLPLTGSGKIDRAALPLPGPDNMLPTGAGPSELGPETPMERQLAALWCEVLGLPSVGRSDNFFELGGHSLLATQVISRVRSTLGRVAPLRALFESPTLDALARVVEQAAVSDESPSTCGSAAPRARAARDRYKVRLT